MEILGKHFEIMEGNQACDHNHGVDNLTIASR